MIAYSSGQAFKIGYVSAQNIRKGCRCGQFIEIGYSSAQCFKKGFSSVMY